MFSTSLTLCRPAAAIFFVAISISSALAQSERPVIAVGGISHETNTFNPRKTTLKDFETGLGATGILRGQEIIRQAETGNTTMAGFVAAARQYGLELHPTITAGPQTIGIVTDDAFEALMKELLVGIRSARRLDGVYLALHGTMVTESHPHADAEIVRRVRALVGQKVPIVVTHDFHANVSPEIVQLSTALITYKETPHLDSKERGIQAAKIMAGTVRGAVRPVQTVVKPPMLYNIVFQNTFDGPMKPVVDESKRLEQNPRILAVSVPGGYQYADIPAMGPAVVVVADGDRDLAEREAKRLSDMLWATRDRLKLDLPDPAAAVRLAINESKRPVVLMDTGDNIGGGSSGDSTFILSELLRQRAQGWVVVIADAAAADAAVRAGVGGSFDMLVGGKTDKLHGEPVRVNGRIKSIHDGRFVEPEVRHGGIRYWDMGITTVIEAEGSTPDLPNLLMLTRKRIIPFSLHQLISCGIYPERQNILVAKGTIAPLAAYQPIAARIITVDSPGLTAVNPARFTFRHVRPGLFGLGLGIK